MFGELLKAVVSVVTVPVAVVADVATLGGTLTDRKDTYTGTTLENLMTNLEKAAE